MPGTRPGMTNGGCMRAHQPRHNFAPMCPHSRLTWNAGRAMISRTICGRAGLLILAAGIGLAPMLQASAQSVPAEENQEAAEAAAAPDAEDADIKGLELDWSQLNVDAAMPATRPLSKPGSPQAASGDMSWSSKNNANGSAGVSVKQPLSPFSDTRIGADMTVARQPTTMSELLSEKVANGGNAPQSSGTAWAAITAPGVGSIWDKTAVEARVDPGQESSKLGTSLSKSLPLGDQYSLTLQNGYNVTQQGILPVPGVVARPVRSYETEQSAKTEHCRYRHQPDRRPDAFLRRRQMAAQGRRRTEIVRRRQHHGIDRRDAAGHHQQEPHRGIQAQLVTAKCGGFSSRRAPVASQ